MPDTFAITINGSRPDVDGREPVSEETIAAAEHAALAVFIADGWDVGDLHYDHSGHDEFTGSGDASDFNFDPPEEP